MSKRPDKTDRVLAANGPGFFPKFPAQTVTVVVFGLPGSRVGHYSTKLPLD